MGFSRLSIFVVVVIASANCCRKQDFEKQLASLSISDEEKVSLVV